MKDKLPKCPWFNKLCVKEKCTAYSLEESSGRPHWDNKCHDVVARVLFNQPFCAALNKFLPVIKEEGEEEEEGGGGGRGE